MVLTGYPVEDLALRQTFRDASKAALAKLAEDLRDYGDMVIVVGYLDESAQRRPQNAVAIIYQGQILAKYIKNNLIKYLLNALLIILLFSVGFALYFVIAFNIQIF